ncbi:uncharacterized protein [Manis javanica]|uniref:uncharacterized protein n=1 Tax=Manis javanica TaxID=9974 RepID=UPI003C6CD1A1
MAKEGLCSLLLLLCPLSRPQEPFVTRPPSVMRACCAVPKHRPSGQLPEGSSADQTMQYPLLSLKSILDTWLSFTSTSWGSAIIAGILCSVGLFLLSLHFHPSDLYSPSSRNIRKCHLQPREKNRRRKRGAALRGCRGRLREQELASSLISHVECHQSRTPDRSHDHRSHQDTLGENKPQSLIRTEIRHPERPTLQKQLERQRALSSGVKRPQEVCSVPTSTRPEDSRVAAMLPENLPISPEMRKVLEQHLQEQFIRPPWELPGKIRKTLEQVRLQGELPATSQAQEPHRPSRTVTFPRESSPDSQKVGLWHSQDLGRGPRGFTVCVP